MSRTVLIADGSQVMRRVVERSLRLAGLDAQQVYEASDGNEALALAQQHRPDIVLADISLAGMDGLQLLRQLRQAEETRDTPVVFISSQAVESQVAEALELGCNGYIRKPFTGDQVKDYIAPLFA
jgi:two-component system chemotaxis response regulator CheY